MRKKMDCLEGINYMLLVFIAGKPYRHPNLKQWSNFA